MKVRFYCITVVLFSIPIFNLASAQTSLPLDEEFDPKVYTITILNEGYRFNSHHIVENKVIVAENEKAFRRIMKSVEPDMEKAVMKAIGMCNDLNCTTIQFVTQTSPTPANEFSSDLQDVSPPNNVSESDARRTIRLTMTFPTIPVKKPESKTNRYPVRGRENAW